jgi:hypothetical protein
MRSTSALAALADAVADRFGVGQQLLRQFGNGDDVGADRFGDLGRNPLVKEVGGTLNRPPHKDRRVPADALALYAITYIFHAYAIPYIFVLYATPYIDD